MNKIFFVSEDNLVSIGNNRLSVIDKQNGKQPMFSNNKRFVTVFNGCIYNFKEIKKFLGTKKVNFTSNSDTEVVANSFEHFGMKAFNYFDGWPRGVGACCRNLFKATANRSGTTKAELSSEDLSCWYSEYNIYRLSMIFSLITSATFILFVPTFYS